LILISSKSPKFKSSVHFKYISCCTGCNFNNYVATCVLPARSCKSSTFWVMMLQTIWPILLKYEWGVRVTSWADARQKIEYQSRIFIPTFKVAHLERYALPRVHLVLFNTHQFQPVKTTNFFFMFYFLSCMTFSLYGQSP
jgi:hypothetical protein